MKKKWFGIMLSAGTAVCGFFAGCGRAGDENTGISSDSNEGENLVSELPGGIAPPGGEIFDDTTIFVYAQKDLRVLLSELVNSYQQIRPTVAVQVVYEDDAALEALPKERAACDIVFLVRRESLDALAAEAYLLEDTSYFVVKDENGGTECLSDEENVSDDVTAQVMYAFAQTANQEADELARNAAFDFVQFLISDMAMEIYQQQP